MNEEFNKANTGAESAAEAAGQPTQDVGAASNVIPLPKEEAPQEAPTSGVYVHKFGKPFTSGGKTYKTLNFYFERLVGKDMTDIENEMMTQQMYAITPEVSRSFQCRMAAKASGIGSDVLESMPLNEFNRITNAARDFLLL